MFYLKRGGSGDAKYHDQSNEDEFGWWLSNREDPKLSHGKDCRSSGSSSSMLSCIDSDDTENYALAEDFRQKSTDSCEKIELTPLNHDDIDVALIEEDANRRGPDLTTATEAQEFFDKSDTNFQRPYGLSYTPERLVRCQEYRILTPSPRYLSPPQGRTPRNESPREVHRCRRRLNYVLDSKEISKTQMNALLNPIPSESPAPVFTSHRWVNHNRSSDGSISEAKVNATEEALNVTDSKQSISFESSDSISKRSSDERLNVTWEDCKKMTTHSSSLEDTSGIQSNDWSSETHSDVQNAPLCLCDELAIASTNYRPSFSQERRSAINEVVSILEVLDTEPHKAAVLLEEDRFCDSTSSHDQLTRLALAIETDANMSDVLDGSQNLFEHLQRKVEKLQASSKDIYRDICNLRQSFQCDEERMIDISSDASRLLEDVHEVRYLDDLLNLLRGELERISKRNWPFVIGHTEHHSEEMNLII